MLHLSWMSKDVIDKAERIHLGVANGTRSKALLWNNIMYSHHTARPLISVGQLKAMLDLRLVWDDGPPILLFCSSGIKYVLIRSRVFMASRLSRKRSSRFSLPPSRTSLSRVGSGVMPIGEMLLVGTLKFTGIRCDEIILKQSRRRRRRMRLSILPVRDMICSAFPVKGQMRKIVPKGHGNCTRD